MRVHKHWTHKYDIKIYHENQDRIIQETVNLANTLSIILFLHLWDNFLRKHRLIFRIELFCKIVYNIFAKSIIESDSKLILNCFNNALSQILFFICFLIFIETR